MTSARHESVKQPHQDIKNLIRTIADFPKPGIQFRDVSTLINSASGLRATIAVFVDHYKTLPIEKIVAIESRGFILGGAIAERLGCGMVMARKRGKLPAAVERQEYELEYGTDCIEIHKDAISSGDRCLVVDDLLATGGTSLATCQLIERLGGQISGCAFIVNLPELEGAKRLQRYKPFWLVDFAGH